MFSCGHVTRYSTPCFCHMTSHHTIPHTTTPHYTYITFFANFPDISLEGQIKIREICFFFLFYDSSQMSCNALFWLLNAFLFSINRSIICKTCVSLDTYSMSSLTSDGTAMKPSRWSLDWITSFRHALIPVARMMSSSANNEKKVTMLNVIWPVLLNILHVSSNQYVSDCRIHSFMFLIPIKGRHLQRKEHFLTLNIITILHFRPAFFTKS